MSLASKLNCGRLAAHRVAGWWRGELSMRRGTTMKSERVMSKVSFIASVGLWCLVACSTSSDRPARESVARTSSALSSLTQAAFVMPSFATVPFPAAQTAGDLNVVVVGWYDTTTSVTSVTDTAGNQYVLALGPTALPGTGSQSV
jgi:hypothetical protein